MKIALDASSGAVKGGSGIPVLIRSLVSNLIDAAPSDEFVICYRASRLKKRKYFLPLNGENASQKIIQEPFNPWFSRSIDIFHGLDSRLPGYHHPVLIATIMDLFSLITEDFAMERFREKKIKRYKDVAERAHLIIAISENTKKDIIRFLGVEPERIIVVYPGYDDRLGSCCEDEITSLRKKYDLPRRYILYVGNISTRKNLKGLISSFSQLQARKEAKNVGLVLAGRDRFGFEEVHKAAGKIGKGIIRFLGYVPKEDLPPLYAGAEVFAFPSLYEGFGIPVLEAMSAGVAVVSSNRGSLPEAAGDAAILVNPEDYTAFAGALEHVLSDEKLRSNLIEKGFAHVKKFSWRRCAEETMAVYRKAVQTR